MWQLMLTRNYTPPKILKTVNEEWKFKHEQLKDVSANRYQEVISIGFSLTHFIMAGLNMDHLMTNNFTKVVMSH